MTEPAPNSLSLLQQGLETLETEPVQSALLTETAAREMQELLTQCDALREGTERPLLRSLHHFACTGGTLISKCIAAMPCIRLLSEVDPLSEMTHRQAFVPTDLIGLAKLGSAPPAKDTLIRIFLAGLTALETDSQHEGRDLVLRDHSHSHFCHTKAPLERPSLRDILRADYRLLSLVTVRHPLDSYMSVLQQGWATWDPYTLEEYANRYHMFLDQYDGVEIIRYEDFLKAPPETMQKICAILRLAYNPHFQEVFAALHLSGDSGRRGTTIAPRSRRSVSAELQAEARHSARYTELCIRLNYDPKPKTA